MPKAETAARARAWQRMLSGRRLDLLDPSPLDIELDDIAHGLARVARWNGQTFGRNIFSVAQHTLLVEELARRKVGAVDRRLGLALLLHDAPEYVIGDMISPFKAVIGDTYKSVEKRILRAILLRFSLPPEPDSALLRLSKRADRASAFFEAVGFAGFTRAEAERIFGRPALGPDAFLQALEPLSVEAAQQRFLARFAAIERGEASSVEGEASK